MAFIAACKMCGHAFISTNLNKKFCGGKCRQGFARKRGREIGTKGSKGQVHEGQQEG